MSVIDLSQLPPPSIIEMPKFKDLKAQRLAELQALDPTYNALVESDPAMKQLEILVYREMVNIARFNSGVLAVLVAYAKGTDLDQLGANYDVERLTVTPADNTTIPPTAAVMETDDAYRRRIRLSWYTRNTAGSIEAYEYYALSADSSILDAKAYGPQEWPDTVSPGEVWVYILTNSGDGTPSQDLLDKVSGILSGDFVRPLTDYVTVKAPTIVSYTVDATLEVGKGPSADTVQQAALEATQKYADSVHLIDTLVSVSGIYKGAKVAGVDDVALISPTANIDPGHGAASYCTSITLSVDQAESTMQANIVRTGLL